MRRRDTLYILTDSDGFTSCVQEEATILREVGRRPMIAPIKVHHWERRWESRTRCGWVLVNDYVMFG